MPFTAFASAGITGWEVDYALKVFRYASGASMTVQALYSALMNEFDNAVNMDDKVPMTASTPTEFALVNGWFIPQDSMGYLSGGSLRTIGWDVGTYTTDGVTKLTAASFAVNIAAGDIGKTITDGTRTGVLLDFDNTNKFLWVRATSGTAWAGTLSCTTALVNTGTAIGAYSSNATGEDIWANFYSIGTIVAGGVAYLYQNGAALLAKPGYASGHIDMLVRVTQSSVDISTDGTAKAVTAYVRDLGNLFDNFSSAATATGGRNPIPLATSVDTNDDGTGGTYIGSVTFGYAGYVADINGDSVNENYTVQIDGGGLSCANLYKALKYATRGTSAAGTPPTTQAGKFYRYAANSYTEAKQSPFATFAGGKIFGAQGVLIINVSDGNSRVLIDNTGTTRTPPVTVTVTVTGVVSGDRVLVARSTGAGLLVVNKTQFTIVTATSGAGTVTVSGVVPNDIPVTGTIRMGDDPYAYTALVRATGVFTITGTLSRTYTSADSCYVPLIDAAASGTSIVATPLTYVAGINVVYRVRKYAAGAGNSILPFENSGAIAAADISFSAIRTVDPVAT